MNHENPSISRSYCLRKTQERRFSRCLSLPPPSVNSPRCTKTVSFDIKCSVAQFDAHLTSEERSSMWWASFELNGFRSARRRYCGSEELFSSATPEDQHNHAQKVLFLYDMFKFRDGGADVLREFSCWSSRQARDMAHKRAVMLSKSTTTGGEQNQWFVFGCKLADIYLDSIFESIDMHWLCGNN
jgi:hypothetical protein